MRFIRSAALSVAAFSLVSASVPALAADEKPFKVTGAEAARGVNHVVIAAFNVGFLTESTDKASKNAGAGGLIGAFGPATRAQSKLEGVTPAMIQAIVDAAYADFVAQLTAKGFTVADSAAMFAGPHFAKVKPVNSPYSASMNLEKNSKGKTNFYKPSQLPSMVILPGDFAATGLGAIGMNMGSISTSMGMVNHAKNTGQAVLDVVYVVDFSEVKRAGAFSFKGINVNSGLSIIPQYSKMTVVAPAGKQALLTLNQPVEVDGDFLSSAATGKASGAMESVGNVAGGLLGAMGGPAFGFGKTKRVAITAKPGAYEEGAIKAASLANERMVNQLAAMR